MNDESFDYCAWFAKIAEDPSADVPAITVRHYLLAALHYEECAKCKQLVDSVPDDGEEELFGEN